MNYIQQALDTIDFNVSSKTSTYYNEYGTQVPRVTEILSRTIHSDGLMYWANSIGRRGLRYSDVLNNAAKQGTRAHEAIEKFLKDKLETNDNIPFLGFMMWYNVITNAASMPITVVYVEHKLSCKWFGGTLDALLKIGDKTFLVDFKTSNYVSFNYFLQLAAYRFMLKEKEAIDIDGVIVLQLDKEEPGFKEYLLDFSIPEHLTFINQCENTFLSLVYAYYNLYQVESVFKNIF